jgi:hypothetical protein
MMMMKRRDPSSLPKPEDRVADDGQTPAARPAPDRAARIAMKEQRARDAALAMQEYEAEKRAVLANAERLRALRLAQEAGNRLQEKTKKQVKKDR